MADDPRGRDGDGGTPAGGRRALDRTGGQGGRPGRGAASAAAGRRQLRRSRTARLPEEMGRPAVLRRPVGLHRGPGSGQLGVPETDAALHPAPGKRLQLGRAE